MSGRPKRQASAPKKFSIEEGYSLPDSPARSSQQQRVLRYLNADDLNRTLENLTVYVLWPEDGLWYEAIIHKVNDALEQTATLFYTETSEEETVNLEELITDRHVAFLEMRSVGIDLKEDEFLADGKIHIATSLHSGSEVSSVMSDSSE